MDANLRASLEEHAKRLGRWMDWDKNGDWDGFDRDQRFERVEIVDSNTVVYHYKTRNRKETWIKFDNIRPSRIESIVLGEERLMETESRDNSSFVVTNGGSANMTQLYEFDVTESTNYSESVGTKVTAGLSQKISYGAGPIKGETDFSLSVERDYSKTTGGSQDIKRMTRSEVTVPAGKKVIVTNKRDRMKYQRTDTFTAGIEYSIRIFDKRDFEYYWDSNETLNRVLMGNGNDNESMGSDYRGRPMSQQDADWRCNFATVSYECENSFDKAVSGNIAIQEVDID